MSAVFAGGTQAGIKPERSTIQKLLDENGQLIQAVVRYQNMGRANDALRLQQLLQRNLTYLASLADASLLKAMNQADEPKNESIKEEGSA